MSSLLPKGQQTAYQRWEMASFGDVRPAQMERAAAAARVSQAELDAIKEQARTEAYAAGFQEAYAVGYNEGQEAGYKEMQGQAQAILEHLSVLQTSFEQQLHNAHEEVGKELIELAIHIAQSMTATHFDVHPESIVDVANQAIDMLPAVHQPALLFFEPEDLHLVKELCGDQLEKSGWRLTADPHLTRGGCRIETAQNLIDASFESRWKSLVDSLMATPALTSQQDE